MTEKTWQNYKQNKPFKPSPLKDIKVLEVCTMLLGPMGPALLAQLGAEVIRCEIPPMGDSTRSLNPFGWFLKDQSPLLLHINQNKYWLGLDLHKPEGAKGILRTCRQVRHRGKQFPARSHGRVGYRVPADQEINPRIIFLSKNGYGQWGQYAKENRPSNDGASQALSGYSWMSRLPGQTPLKMRAYIGDNYGGMCAEIAVLAALHYRDRTGKGQFIEFSQTENIMRTMSWIWPYHADHRRKARSRPATGMCRSVRRTRSAASTTLSSLWLRLRRRSSPACAGRWASRNWLKIRDSRIT